MHISLGFPDLRDNSSLSLLRRVQLGIQRVQALKQSLTKRTRLPITLGLLDQLCSLSENTKHPNHCLLWAVAALYFAGFFRAGELLPTSASSSATSRCIAWGNVTVDNPGHLEVIKVHLNAISLGKEWLYMSEDCKVKDVRSQLLLRTWYREVINLVHLS